MQNDLTAIDLGGRGRFTTDCAGFEVQRYFLEREWEYIYGDERLYWRLNHNGRGYVQTQPPGGLYWLRQAGEDDPPAWQVYIVPDGDASRAFTNFRGRLTRDALADRDPADDSYTCRWQLGHAEIAVAREGLRVTTLLGVADTLGAALMQVRIENTGQKPRNVVIIPRLTPWLKPAQGAAWDMPWLYQATRFDAKTGCVQFEMRSPSGNPAERHHLSLLTGVGWERLCLNEAIFVGRGTPHAPSAMHAWRQWPTAETTTVEGIPLFAALTREITLAPGESWSFTMAIADADIVRLAAVAAQPQVEFAAQEARRRADLARYAISTPEPAFTRYVNEYLGLQQRLILYRGWPCNMMGVRDTAQDCTAAVAWYPAQVRAMLLRILETERSDGWCLRQFSTDGRHGRHDARPYVDGGLWVWELAYEYICQTRDFSVLDEQLPFLDCDTRTSVLDHLGRLLAYYQLPENIGEHGLCKIREGDWNDSVNRAGLQGRGESVMVSCHLIYCLRQAARLAEYLGPDVATALPQPAAARATAARLRSTVRTAALTPQGFLRGVFSDSGRWIFSENDLDGHERINIPVNAFGLLADVFDRHEIPRLLERLRGLRLSCGYPLFWPALGDPPMDGVGRIGSGDLRPGLGENGSCYNHGCHGFLARALAAVGEGDLFLDVMLCLFPYDQQRHPVAKAHTAPYAIVNVYKTAPGREGEGGDTFFSGTIPTATRNIYQGLLGVYAEPNGLRIQPCLPFDWDAIEGRIIYAGHPLQIAVRRTTDGYEVRVDGQTVSNGWYPAPSGR